MRRQATADLTLELEKRNAGGPGICVVRGVMTRMNYEYLNGLKSVFLVNKPG